LQNIDIKDSIRQHAAYLTVRNTFSDALWVPAVQWRLRQPVARIGELTFCMVSQDIHNRSGTELSKLRALHSHGAFYFNGCSTPSGSQISYMYVAQVNNLKPQTLGARRMY